MYIMTNNHPILSIVVPVYNVAPYLRKCVDSLLAQDYADYEIILVDDGSLDECPVICDSYAAEHDNIRVVHRANGGLSAARNSGIEVAQGEYIMFVDSDDYLEPNVLNALMTQIEREQLDVLRFDYQNVRIKHEGISELESEGVYEEFEPNKKPRYIDFRTEVVDGETYLNERMSYACYAVMFIMRREIAPAFAEGILFEDTEWTPRMLLAAKRVNSTPLIVYNYYWREGSITQKFDLAHINKKVSSLMQVNLSLQSLLPKVQDRRWLYGCIADNTYCILNNVATYDDKSVPYWIGVINKNKMLPLRGYKVRKITLLRYKLINLSPRIYCWLRHIRVTCTKK